MFITICILTALLGAALSTAIYFYMKYTAEKEEKYWSDRARDNSDRHKEIYKDDFTKLKNKQNGDSYITGN